MGKPHKWAELIKAWADGADIEYRFADNPWSPNNDPDWGDRDYEYRLKPEPRSDVTRWFRLESHPLAGLRFSDNTEMPCSPDDQIIEVTFDGETGKIKKVR